MVSFGGSSNQPNYHNSANSAAKTVAGNARSDLIQKSGKVEKFKFK